MHLQWTFFFFLDEEILNFTTNETNRFVAQLLSTPFQSHSHPKDNSHLKNKNNKEIKLFVDLIIWTELAFLPTIINFWRKLSIYVSYIQKLIKHKRFEL